MCSKCGCYGHLGRNCTVVKEKPEQSQKDAQAAAASPTAGGSYTRAENDESPTMEQEFVAGVTDSIITSINSHVAAHGTWLTVERKSRNSKSKDSSLKNKKPPQSMKNQ